MSARKADPETSHRSAVEFQKHVPKVNDRIIDIVRASTWDGSTQSQVVALIPEYKATSITPRFAPLVRRGQLVLVRIGTTKPTKGCPSGRPLYITRFDKQTNRDVNVYWVPEFAPIHKAAA